MRRFFCFAQEEAELLFYLHAEDFLFHAFMASEGGVLKHTEVKINIIGNVECA